MGSAEDKTMQASKMESVLELQTQESPTRLGRKMSLVSIEVPDSALRNHNLSTLKPSKTRRIIIDEDKKGALLREKTQSELRGDPYSPAKFHMRSNSVQPR